MAVNEPIKLKDMVRSLASTLVMTSRFLDQSTIDLQNLYSHSNQGAGSALTPPRFTLDEVVLDLSFVVDEVVLARDRAQPPKPTPAVQPTSVQQQWLLDRLESLRAEEEQKFHEQQAELQRQQAHQRQARAAWQQYEQQRSQVSEELHRAQKRREALDEEIDRRKHLAARLRRRLEEGEGEHEPLLEQFRRLERQFEQLEAEREQVEQALARGRSLLADMETHRPPEPPPAAASPPTAPVPEAAPADYRRLWTEFFESYSRLHEIYAEAVGAYEQEQPLPRIPSTPPFPEDLHAALERAEVASRTQDKVGEIYDDYQQLRKNLGLLATLVADSKGEGIRVRMDPEAISEAPEAARQKLRLTFRSESRENVQLEGQSVDIPR